MNYYIKSHIRKFPQTYQQQTYNKNEPTTTTITFAQVPDRPHCRGYNFHFIITHKISFEPLESRLKDLRFKGLWSQNGGRLTPQTDCR